MSVIKTNPSENISHLPVEGDTVPSKLNSMTFSHKSMAKKIAEAINYKKQMQLVFNKNENQQLTDSIEDSAILKNSHPININSKITKRIEVLNVNGADPSMIGLIASDKNVFSEYKIVIDNDIEINPQEEGGAQFIIDKNKAIGDKEEINNRITVGGNKAIGDKEEINNRITVGGNKTIGDKEEINNQITIDGNKAIGDKEEINNRITVGGNKAIGDKEEINNQITMDGHKIIGNKKDINNQNTIADNKTIGDDVVIGYRPSIIAKPSDEDDIPLFNNMMIGFSSHNMPYWEKDKLSFSGNVGPKLSEGTEHSQEQSLIMLVSESPVESILKKQKGQAETSPQAIKPVVNMPTQLEVKPEWDEGQLKQNVQTHNQSLNLVKNDSLKNSTTLLKQQLATHHMSEKGAAEQGSKGSIVPDIAQKFSFEKSESFMRPSIPEETEELPDSKLSLLPESSGKFVNNLPDEKQKPIVSPQITSEESIDFPNNVIAAVINEMAIRPQVSPQTSQPHQAAYKTPELMENNPLLGESKGPETVARSLTYTFSQWQSSPSVTFELASKGEFIASTQSQEVQVALNENKHLLDHENSVHIRREDERQQQHRNRQHHEQQQEED